jgi:hypothetical protein
MTVPEDRSLATLDTEKKSVEDDESRIKSPETNGTTELKKNDNLPQQNTPDDITLQSSKESEISAVNEVSDSAVDIAAEKVNDDNEIDSPLSKRRRRRQALLKALYIILFNAAIPIGLYYALKPHIPAVWALVASTAPTIISVIAQAAIARRLDMIGVAVIFGMFAGHLGVIQFDYRLYPFLIETLRNRLHFIRHFGCREPRSKIIATERIVCVSINTIYAEMKRKGRF